MSEEREVKEIIVDGKPRLVFEKDATNPDYYQNFPIETIDMMIKIWGNEYVHYHCLMTAFKYRMRMGNKESITLDTAKENWYLDKAKELEGAKLCDVCDGEGWIYPLGLDAKKCECKR